MLQGVQLVVQFDTSLKMDLNLEMELRAGEKRKAVKLRIGIYLRPDPR
jgi:hypothetical protein